jgi:lipocalin
MENPELPNRLTETNRISVGDVPLLSKDFDYSVWKTDYDRYCVVYSCHQLLPLVLKAESLWIFGREKTLDPELLAELRTFAQENGVNVANLEMAVQN